MQAPRIFSRAHAIVSLPGHYRLEDTPGGRLQIVVEHGGDEVILTLGTAAAEQLCKDLEAKLFLNQAAHYLPGHSPIAYQPGAAL